MAPIKPLELRKLRAQAGRAARTLKLLANERRLLILCELADGEAAVGTLAQEVGLGQSALSQHLAKLRNEKLVATRRQAQTVFYRIADPKVKRLLSALKEIFCP
ncbi:MAG TPA: metalloregulator ArsR/SmtB family transcription factor [Rhodospirillales bacterium]|jgi:ArsR family transcriptional regulator